MISAQFTNTGTIRKSAGDTSDRSYLRVSNLRNDGGNFDVQVGRLALGEARVSELASHSRPSEAAAPAPVVERHRGGGRGDDHLSRRGPEFSE